MILYHNPRWGKSRESVKILNKKGIYFTTIEYLKSPLTASELHALGLKLGLRPKEFIRNKESEFNNLELSDKLNNDKQLIQAIADHPKLMERPILVNGEKAVIGRPPENILNIIWLPLK